MTKEDAQRLFELQTIDSGIDERRVVLAEVDDGSDALAALDCFVLASPAEGNSLALLEAWAAGVPTVTTPVGAVPELERRHGPMSVSVPLQPNPHDLAAGVLAAIAPENRPTVENARAVVRGHYTAQQMGAAWSRYLVRIAPRRATLHALRSEALPAP